MEHYGRALDLAQVLEETRLTAIVLDQIGGVYTKLGDYDTAYEYYQRALASHPEAASFTKGNLARLNQLIGNPNEAKRITEVSNRAYRIEGPVYGPALIKIERAESAFLENDLETAVAEAREGAWQEGLTTVGHEEEAVKANLRPSFTKSVVRSANDGERASPKSNRFWPVSSAKPKENLRSRYGLMPAQLWAID